MKTIDIFQRIRLSTYLFVLMLVAPAEVGNSSNRAVVATTCGIYFRGRKDKKPVMSMKL